MNCDSTCVDCRRSQGQLNRHSWDWITDKIRECVKCYAWDDGNVDYPAICKVR
jgi:hypothetical protein